MQFSEHDLRAAVSAGALEADRMSRLMEFLTARQAGSVPAVAGSAAPAPRFDLAHLLWYAGALIIITAMGLFSTLAFSSMGGPALTATAVVYGIVFAVAGHHLWHARDLKIPGGLLITVAVSMAPLAVFGIQESLGWWGQFGKPGNVREFYIWIKGGWLFMELAAIVAGLVALRFYRFPFIVMIIAFALWFMSMDVTPWIYGSSYTWEHLRSVSMWYGLAVILVAVVVDRWRNAGDFAFWLHLFGMIMFWCTLSMKDSGSEFGKMLYCLLNVGFVFLSVVLSRRVYAVFGTLGVACYLGYLARSVFKDSMMFPFALSLIGVAVIALGLLYHKKQAVIAAWVEEHMPAALMRLRPAHAR